MTRPLAGHVWEPVGAWSGAGVLLLPAVGYEYWTSFHSLRALAEACARRGHLVLRLDYDGYGDSVGDQVDADRWARWCEAVDFGVEQLRDWGAERVGLAGLRLGATIALLGGERNRAAAVAAMLPIVSGRRYVRSLKLIRDAFEPPPSVEPGTIAFAGAIFTVALMEDLKSIDLAGWDGVPAPNVLLLEREGAELTLGPLAERLTADGVAVTHSAAAGFDLALDRPTEEAEVAREPVDLAAEWLDSRLREDSASADATLTAISTTSDREQAQFAWRAGAVRERFTTLGAAGLFGVETWPDDSDTKATLVFLNTGSEPHVGPGRAWVEYARDLAQDGYLGIRIDFRGWGDSPDDGFLPGRPFNEHCFEDVATIVADLRDRGHHKIVLVGLCSGAWLAMQASKSVHVDGVIAINPQLAWQRGDPVEALVKDTRIRRAKEIEEFKRHGAELEQTVPHETKDLLLELQAIGSPVLLVYGDSDDGIEFLRDRLPATWSAALAEGTISLAEIAEIDHPMHKYWLRPAVLSAVREFLAKRVS